MKETRVYISHSIRGRQGINATAEQMEENNRKAIEFGRQLTEEFPTIGFYIPGAVDEFVKPAFDKGHLTLKQILDVDCDIISRSNFIIVFAPDDFISSGMKVEIDYATLHSISIISAIDGSYEEYVQKIIYAVNCHLISIMR